MEIPNTIMQAVANETLADLEVEWYDKAAACVILASGGYPGSYEKGKVMTFPETIPSNTVIYHAGDARKDGNLVTNGGRVLGITAVADTLKEALTDAYAVAETVEFEGKYMRHDIGQKALAIQED